MTINCWWCSGSGEMRTGSADRAHRVECAHCNGTGNSTADDDQDINTHHIRIGFGKHAGELWTRLPISYLRWMVNQDTRDADIAKAELARRGISLLDRPVEISGHAIDSASLRLAKYWKRDHQDDEGLHAWLMRKAVDALDHHKADGQGRIHHNDVRFIFEFGELYPTLKTVMWKPKNSGKQSHRVRQ